MPVGVEEVWVGKTLVNSCNFANIFPLTHNCVIRYVALTKHVHNIQLIVGFSCMFVSVFVFSAVAIITL